MNTMLASFIRRFSSHPATGIPDFTIMNLAAAGIDPAEATSDRRKIRLCGRQVNMSSEEQLKRLREAGY